MNWGLISQSSDLLKLCLILLLFFGVFENSFSQSFSDTHRSFSNSSFESGLIFTHTELTYTSSQASKSPEIAGWYSTHSDFNNKQAPIEHWASGFAGIDAYKGDYFVEVNAVSPSILYQPVYLVNGDQIDWHFAHRRRNRNINETVILSVYDPANQSALKELTHHTSSPDLEWKEVEGTTRWTGPSGGYWIGFEAEGGLVNGNFLDDVTLSLQSLLEFPQDTLRLKEGSGSLPFLALNGELKQDASLRISLDPISSEDAQGYQLNTTIIDLSPGNYSLSDRIDLPVDITNNDLQENNRFFRLNIESTNGPVVLGDANFNEVSQLSMVVIIEEDDLCKNPGSDTELTICSGEQTWLNLFSQLGGQPDPGGAWSVPEHVGLFELGDGTVVSFESIPVGDYRFVYTHPASGTCSGMSSELIVRVTESFVTGSVLMPLIEVCEGTNFSLFSNLENYGEGGEWQVVPLSNNTRIPDISNPESVSFVDFNDGDSYIFTYSGLNCEDEEAGEVFYRLRVTSAPDPGDDATVTVCEGAELNLLESLSGTPAIDGAWTSTIPQSSFISEHVISLDGLAGEYIFEYTTENAEGNICGAGRRSAQLVVNIGQSGDAGANNNASVLNRGIDTRVNLFGLLGGTAQPNGVWIDKNNSGVDLSLVNVDFLNVDAGIYEFDYIIAGDNICKSDTATLIITVDSGPFAGTSGTINLCSDAGAGSIVDLNAFINREDVADEGGGWFVLYGPDIDLSMPDAVDLSGFSPQRFLFSYLVNEGDLYSSSQVAVNLNLPAQTGFGGEFFVCNDAESLNLFDFLLGNVDPGGIWTGPQYASITLDQKTGDLSLGNSLNNVLNFSYTFDLNSVCNNPEAVVKLVTLESPKSGVRSENIKTCGSTQNQIVNLFDGFLDNSFSQGGTWLELTNSGVIINDPSAIDFSLISVGTYVFEYTVQNECSESSSHVVVDVRDSPAGSFGQVSICNQVGGGRVNLFDVLNGTPELNGLWTSVDTEGIDISDPLNVDFSTIPEGVYRFLYVLSGLENCQGEPASALVEVKVNDYPDGGTDATVGICAENLENFRNTNLFNLINTPDEGGDWVNVTSSTVDISNPSNVDLTSLGIGKHELNYELNDANCGVTSTRLIINREMEFMTGTNRGVELCSNEELIIQLNDFLPAMADPGGVWLPNEEDAPEIISDVIDFRDSDHSRTYSYLYTAPDGYVCSAEADFNLSFSIIQIADAGRDKVQLVCITSAGNEDLNTYLQEGVSMEGMWFSKNNPTVPLATPELTDLALLGVGIHEFEYVLPDITSCEEDVFRLSFHVSNAFNPANDTTVSICRENSEAIQLFDLLGENADIGGNWQSLSSQVSISNNSVVNLSEAPAQNYSFTYTTIPKGDCGESEATLTIVLTENLYAGLDGEITVCNKRGESALNLFNSLEDNPQPGGYWVDIDNSGAIIQGDLALFEGVSHGDYEFEYVLSRPEACSVSSATLTVSVEDHPDAGPDLDFEICGDGTILDFVHVGDVLRPEGGEWYDLNGSGVDLTDPSSVSFNISDTALPVSTFKYLYILNGQKVCMPDTAQVTVYVYPKPDAGEDNSLYLCDVGEDRSIDLFAMVRTDDQSGIWKELANDEGPSYSGVNLSNPSSVNFRGVANGVYTYQYRIEGNNFCSEAITTLSVYVERTPLNPGNTRLEIDKCASGTSRVNLFDGLEGAYATGGTWKPAEDNNLELDLSGPTRVDFSGVADNPLGYEFFYEIESLEGCEPQQSFTRVFILDQVQLGRDTTIVNCSSEPVFYNLFDLLGIEIDEGSWFLDDAPYDIINPEEFNISELGIGKKRLRYRLDENEVCPADFVELVINNQVPPNYGETIPIIVCSTQSSVNLLSGLSGEQDPGGVWTYQGSTIQSPMEFDIESFEPGEHSFEYSILSETNCEPTSTEVILSKPEPVITGEDSEVIVCNSTNTSVVNLFSELSGSMPGGNWYDASGANVDLSNPNVVDFEGVESGTYQFYYFTPESSPCETSSSVLTVNVTDGPQFMEDSGASICNDEFGIINFNLLRGTISPGDGIWEYREDPGQNNRVSLIPDNYDAISFEGIEAGVYRFVYRLEANGVCGPSEAEYTIEVFDAIRIDPANPIEVCRGDLPVNLFDVFINPVPEGIWHDMDNSGVDLSDATNIDFKSIPGGVYRFGYTVLSDNEACLSKTAVAYVTVIDRGIAGEDVKASLCLEETAQTPINLNDYLTIDVDQSGNWYRVAENSVDEIVPEVSIEDLEQGINQFLYAVFDQDDCRRDEMNLSLDINFIAISETSIAGVVCQNQEHVNLNSYLSGGALGSWVELTSSGVDLSNPESVSFQSTLPGNYLFQYNEMNGGFCTGFSIELTLTVEEKPDAGLSNSVIICTEDDSVIPNLNALLRGNPDQGGDWFIRDNDNPDIYNITQQNQDFRGVNGSQNFLFRYIVPGNEFCLSDTSELAIHIFPKETEPLAGIDVTKVTCNAENAADLYKLLGDDISPGGLWFDLSASGVDLSDPTRVDLTNLTPGLYNFRYVIPSSTCTSYEATLSLDIRQFTLQNAHINVCSEGASVLNLLNLVGGEGKSGNWLSSSDLFDTDSESFDNGSAVDFTGLPENIYEFEYILTESDGSCSELSAIVTVEVGNKENAGEDISLSICNNNPDPISLLTQLDQGQSTKGILIDVDGAGVDLSEPQLVDFNNVTPGNYRFYYQVGSTTNCTSSESEIVIKVTGSINAGKSNTISINCQIGDRIVSLPANLKGIPDTAGTWTQVAGPEVDYSNPERVDFEAAVDGRYEFQYTVSGDCGTRSSLLVILLGDFMPLRGNQTSLTACNNESAYDLVTAWSSGGGLDPGGVLIDENNSGIDFSVFPEPLDLRGVKADDYQLTYLFPANGICEESSVTVTLTIRDSGYAGEDQFYSFCGDITYVNLHDLLDDESTTGGNWSSTDYPDFELVNPEKIDFTDLLPGEYKFYYSFDEQGGCNTDSATIIITKLAVANAGADKEVALCALGEFNLENLLHVDVTTRGTWLPFDNSTVTGQLPIVDLELLGEGVHKFIYQVKDELDCGIDESIYTLDVKEAPNAGQSNTVQVCEGTGYEFEPLLILGENVTAGGVWSDLNNSGLDFTQSTVDFSAVPDGVYHFVYQLQANVVCNSTSTELVVYKNSPLELSNNVLAEICSSVSVVSLNDFLDFRVLPRGIWFDLNTGTEVTDPENLIISSLSEEAQLYEFRLVEDVCEQATVLLELRFDRPFMAGEDNMLEVCNNDELINLFSALGNASDGGVWSDINQSDVDLSNPQQVSFQGVPEGVYLFKYRVGHNTVCGESSATIKVHVSTVPHVGNSREYTFCNGNAVYNFYDLLDSPDPGGVWVDNNESGVDLSTPGAVSLDGLMAGQVYTFTYTTTERASCPSVSVLTINLEEKRDAGEDHTLFICRGQVTEVNLLNALQGTPNVAGSWVFPGAIGLERGTGIHDLIITEEVEEGDYEFVYEVRNSRDCLDTTVLDIKIFDELSTGESTEVELCNSDTSTFSLFNLMGGDPMQGGEWTNLTIGGPDVSDPTSVSYYDLEAKIYQIEYRIDAMGDCSPPTSILTINLNRASNAGQGSLINFCNDSGNYLNLISAITEEVDGNGSWINLNSLLVDLSDPSRVDLSGLPSGLYHFRYIVRGEGICDVSSSTVSVNVSGSTGIEVLNDGIVTNNGMLLDLVALLSGNNISGTWDDLDQKGVNLENPREVSFDGVAPGIYRFGFTSTTNTFCEPDILELRVRVIAEANSGMNTRVAFCSNEAVSLNLFTLMQGSPESGGQWVSSSGRINIENPEDVNLSDEQQGIYEFSYILETEIGLRINTLTVELFRQISAGSGHSQSPLVLCNDDTTPLDLFGLVGTESREGVWTDVNGADVDMSVPSNVSFYRVMPGFYEFQYVVSSSGSCPPSHASIFIEIRDAVDAGNDNQIEICNTSEERINLFALLTNADEGGEWRDESGEMVNNPESQSFSGREAGVYTFSYVLSQEEGCIGSDEAIISVHVTDQLRTGAAPATAFIVCKNQMEPVILFDILEGDKDPAGIWLDNDGEEVPDGQLFVGDLDVEEHTFTYKHLKEGTCVEASTQIAVDVRDFLDTGKSNVIEVCEGTASISLIDFLGGTPLPGGVWVRLDGEELSRDQALAYDLSGLSAGASVNFSYSFNNADCSGESAALEINVVSPPNSGVPVDLAARSFCSSTAEPVDLSLLLTGEDEGGVWQDSNGNTLLSPLISVLDVAEASRVFRYMPPTNQTCMTPVFTDVEVFITKQADSGLSNEVSICNNDLDTPLNIFASLLGTPEPGGVWIYPDGIEQGSDPDILDLQQLNVGTYSFEYRALQEGNCDETSATLTLNIVQQLDAGLDNEIILTSRDDAIISLFDSLLGTPDEGGEWRELSNSGVSLLNPETVNFSNVEGGVYRFEYRIPSGAGCSVAQAVITVMFLSGNLSSLKASIEKIVSPNGDGVNDVWVINEIHLFNSNKVRIYNRWGELVYDVVGYNNQSVVFLGLSDVGKELLDGTYFYSITVEGNNESIEGFLTLLR